MIMDFLSQGFTSPQELLLTRSIYLKKLRDVVSFPGQDGSWLALWRHCAELVRHWGASRGSHQHTPTCTEVPQLGERALYRWGHGWALL